MKKKIMVGILTVIATVVLGVCGASIISKASGLVGRQDSEKDKVRAVITFSTNVDMSGHSSFEIPTNYYD